METKQRIELPPAYQKIYQDWMNTNRGGKILTTSLSTRLEQWMHRQVAADLGKVPQSRSIETLELGAGTLNHLAFDRRSNFYDVVEPNAELLALGDRSRLRSVFSELSELPLTAKYDRIISIAVLEHICNLPEFLQTCVTHLKTGGVFRAGIPSEGTMFWKLGWMATTARAFKKRYGLDYELIMKHEHVNDASEIVEAVGAVFKKVRVRSFGLSRAISFYQFIEASDPRVE
jgi:SAM-dependent methyltransferase